MRIEGVRREDVARIAEGLGLAVHNGKGGTDRSADKILLRPKQDSDHLRALKPAPKDLIQKKSRRMNVCLHGYYAFMARVLAEYPDALIKTYLTAWTCTSFQASALDWTRREIEERAALETCDCKGDMADELLRTPDQLRGRLIHWRSMPAGGCARKDSGVDRKTYFRHVTGGVGTAAESAEADHFENVTCPTCHEAAYQDDQEDRWDAHNH